VYRILVAPASDLVHLLHGMMRGGIMSKQKQIKRVHIVPGCISCGTCEVICPSVFTVKDISYVNQDANPNDHAEAVREAAEMCPVSVIMVEDDETQ
jgi:ferredoxin